MRLDIASPMPRPWAPRGGALGHAGVAGVAALLLALFVALWVAPERRTQAEASRAGVLAAAQAERLARIAAADRARKAMEQGGMTTSPQWPSGGARDERVAALLAHAAAAGLQVGGLRQTPPQGGAARREAGEAPQAPQARSGAAALQWHVVSLPLRGSYAQIRQFLAAALAADPALALDAVQLQREAGAAPGALRADTTWALAQRAPEAPP